jgi:UDP-N-acetylglucosamine 2-epimerase
MRGFPIDWLTVIDQSAKNLAKRFYPEEKIHVLGQPSFDRLARLAERREDIRGRVRSILSLTSQKLIVFSASASNQFAEEEMEMTMGTLLKYCGSPGIPVVGHPVS